MKLAIGSLVAALCVLATVGYTAADKASMQADVSLLVPADGGPVAEAAIAATVREISTWLVETFGLPPTDDVPQVKFATSAWLTAMRYRRLLPVALQDAAADELAAPGSVSDVVAIYDDATGTVYLGDTWRGDSPADMSVLVHEMVHHLQNRAGSRFSCSEEREMLAYAAQEGWLALFGTSLEREFGIDRLTLLLRTKCLG
ncbi:MAG: DUF6647 family protein [Dongiaceae bacterium]